MSRVTSTVGTGLIILALFAVPPALAEDEAITAAELAAQCSAAGGHLTATNNLRVEGGAAEMGACSIDLGSFELRVRDAHLSLTGDFSVRGGGESQIEIERSTLSQSEQAEGPVHIALVAHRVKVEGSTIDVSGNVHLVADRGDEGRVEVKESNIRSSAGDIFIAASRYGREGKVEVKESRLFAVGDILILASDLRNGRKGEIKVEENAIVAWNDIKILTGPDGKTEVRGNQRALEMDEVFKGIHAMGTVTIASGPEGRTEVRENRIVGEAGVLISSGRETRVRENNFSGSGPIVVRGPRCEARDNTPHVSCTR